jgi:hypothetical protein
VVDLGSLGTRDEQTLTACAVLERLWRERERREPVAIVINEAQNVCPAEPADPLTALATEDAVRIAGEGRKFGLYLIVVTQRPQKIHENVLSQCDNLVLMRMNSVADLAQVAGVFLVRAAGPGRPRPPPSSRARHWLRARSLRTRRWCAPARASATRARRPFDAFKVALLDEVSRKPLRPAAC